MAFHIVADGLAYRFLYRPGAPARRPAQHLGLSLGQPQSRRHDHYGIISDTRTWPRRRLTRAGQNLGDGAYAASVPAWRPGGRDRLGHLDRAAEFWSAALGYVREGDGGDRYLSLLPARRAGIEILLQRVRDAKQGKNRMHLDLRTR